MSVGRSNPVVGEEELREKFIHASGPGGQNVNKVATAVQLRFDAANSPSISPYVKERLKKLAKHLMTDDGEIVIEASRFRSQMKNREDARKRLAALIAEAAKPPPKKRRPTKPSKGAIERRLKAKAGRSQIKKMRGKVRDN